MKILVLCTGNSCRSQMAHGYLSTLLKDRAEVFSAGTKPQGVNPHSITVMAEDGIDISHHSSNHMDEYGEIPFDVVLTVCDNAKELCPVYPGGGRTIHHSFPDPHGDDLDTYRQVRDLILEYCEEFIGAI